VIDRWQLRLGAAQRPGGQGVVESVRDVMPSCVNTLRRVPFDGEGAKQQLPGDLGAGASVTTNFAMCSFCAVTFCAVSSVRTSTSRVQTFSWARARSSRIGVQASRAIASTSPPSRSA
jgi:hypothetical protein